jgi:pilus assembly protein CpaD
MTDTMKNFLRGLSLAAVLVASSCAGPEHNPGGTFEDGVVNHPITVEPSYKSLKLSYSPAGLSNTDAALLRAFVQDYSEHGNGSIAVSAPANVDSQGAITWFADQINALGVSRDHILVATHDAPASDARVEINYVAYQAHTDECGDWSEDLAFTLDNATPKNFGCSVQHNIAAMVADPRDLMAPRAMDGSDASRRATVVGHYEKGEITQATKHTGDTSNEQSAPGASDIQ